MINYFSLNHEKPFCILRLCAGCLRNASYFSTFLYPGKTMFKLLYLDPSTPLHLPNSYTIFEHLFPDDSLHHVNVI